MRLTGNEGIGPDWLASGRVAGLDGLRALSIALVLFCHGAKTAGSPLPLALQERYYYGTLGVDIFFVISGFLITLLLLREESRNGTVSLRGFYTRRAFRILPAYFGYICFVFLLTRLGAAQLRPIDWATALTYTMNILPHHPSRWVVQHVWSLSIEEHFYLLWPTLLVVFGSLRARLVLLLIFPLAVASRYASWTVFRHWIDLNYDFITPNRMDSIAAGCLLAHLVCDFRARPWLGKLERWGTIIFLTAILIVAVSAKTRRFSEMYDVTLGRTVESAAIALCILAVVSSPALGCSETARNQADGRRGCPFLFTLPLATAVPQPEGRALDLPMAPESRAGRHRRYRLTSTDRAALLTAQGPPWPSLCESRFWCRRRRSSPARTLRHCCC